MDPMCTIKMDGHHVYNIGMNGPYVARKGETH